MAGYDLAIYAAHGAFWTVFGIANAVAWRRGAGDHGPAPAALGERTAPRSRALVAFHAVAFAVMYFGIGTVVFGRRAPAAFRGHVAVGLLIIGLGAGIIGWARIYFSSWRFRAKLDAGHRLATGGPYALVRHPIYLGLDLLALGSAVWMPTVVLWLAVVLMVIGSDLRSRTEERLLTEGFGAAYDDYRRRTWRFVPFVY